jgi:thiamine biosynthesis lipoprotein
VTREQHDTFACFGASCSVLVTGDGSRDAVALARRRLLGWHARFTRFDAASELSRFNADPREVVPVSATLARLAQAVVTAGELSGGLVDGTLLADIEAAGYRGDLRAPLPLALTLRLAPTRRPAAPSRGAAWRALAVDRESARVSRPRGVGLDSGGLAKGLFADLLAEDLAGHHSFAVECAGDLRVGGSPRPVHVAGPFDGRRMHTFVLADAGVATSGIGRRSWLDLRGRPAHHLLDPSTGAPAFTGVVQATAVAPTALEAEIRAKAAVLSGPEAATGWLPHGGVVVYDDGTYSVHRSFTDSLAPPRRTSV